MSDNESASDNLGSHLLGRIPSPPDERDYKLATFLGTDADLVAQAVAELKQTTLGFKNKSWTNPPANTHWAKALAYLAQVSPTPTPPPASTDKVWENPQAVLDQGAQGTCVGHGTAQWGNTLPINDKYTHEDALDLYLDATTYDGQPDDPRKPGGGQQGASVRSGMKALNTRKRNSVYARAANLDEVKQWIQKNGPVVIGSDWMNSMFNPDSNGYIKPTGGYAGGHCYLLLGDLPSEGAFQFLNSWGANWGKKGYFKMKYADFQTLLDQQGEAWVSVELPL